MTAPLPDRQKVMSLSEFDAHLDQGTVLTQDSDPLATPRRERTGTPSPGLEQPPAGIPEGYDFLAPLSRGRMGLVYRVWQTKLKRDVALKLILSGARATAEERARFRTEAQAIACLQHPNIVQVYDRGECGGQPFILMEFVHGGSLTQKLNGQPLPPKEAARLVETLARAMHYAHQHQIIHRDLKPANILLAGDSDAPLRECVPKIADFGLAKQLDSESGQTQSNAVLGTPSYMAPEQANRLLGALGPATDVYALGAILYELLTGRVPFLGASVLETLRQVAETEPVPPAQLQPQTPRDLETICLKCLQKEPARRYTTALELADDLRRFLEVRPVRARRVGVWGRAWRWGRRNPQLALLTAALLLTVFVGLALCGWFAYQVIESGQQAESARRQAEENFLRTRRLLPDLVAAGNGPWQQVVERRQARRQALERAGGLYRELCAARPNDRELRGEFAEVLTALSEVALSDERYEAARNLAAEALALWTALRDETPAECHCRTRRADTLSQLAEAEKRLGHLAEMLAASGAALEAYQQLAEEAPENTDRLLAAVAARETLANQLFSVGRAARAQSLFQHCRRSLTAYLERGRDSAAVRLMLVQVLYRLGKWYEARGDTVAARGCWREGCARSVGLTDVLSKDFRAWFYPTLCARCLPSSEPHALSPEEALLRLEQAVRLLEASCALVPDDVATAESLVFVTGVLAECYRDAGRPSDALRVQRRAAAVTPPRPVRSPVLELERLNGVAQVASREEQAGQNEVALVHAREVADGYEAFCHRHAEEPLALAVAVDYCPRLATPLRHIGATAQSRRVAESALRQAQPLVQSNPDAFHLWGLSEVWSQLAKCAMRDHPAAVEAALTEGVVAARRLVVLNPEHRLILDHRLRRLARQQSDNGRRQEAAACFRECATLWPDDADGLRGVARSFRALADAVSHWWTELSPAERDERQGYLAEAARLEKAAEALRRQRE